jgi:carboxyl-terminal processing protease
MQFLKNGWLVSAVMVTLIFSACKKDVDETDNNAAPTAADLVKDTTLLFSKDIYLWYTQIPASFDARSYSDPEKIMTAIRQYSTETGFSQPVDRWSFAAKKADWDKVSSGISGDFGLSVFFRNTDDLRVKLVEESSPAGQAGIRRGWRITRINGSSAINTSNSNFIVENVFYSSNTSFTFQKPDNSTVDITLSAKTYQENPVYVDSVYSVNGKKIGYLSFNSFLGDTSAIYQDFNRIFTDFASQGVNDLIVDLRYNGGGYVSVQEKLANYIAPAAANNGIMMKQEFNNNYADWNSQTTFKKLGSLNLNRVFFIVSGSSASASELLINNLKPYMEVLLVGPSKTYGKPVGYFPIPVGDWYIFPVSFRTTNKNGEGSYFNGLALNSQVADGLDKDWGDLAESCLASAVSYISTGTFRTQSASGAGFRVKEDVQKGNTTLDAPSFKGTVDTRRMK